MCVEFMISWRCRYHVFDVEDELYGDEYLACDGDLHLHPWLPPNDGLSVAEAVEETALHAVNV